MNHSNFCPINFRWYGIGLPWSQRVTGNKGLIPERGPERWPPHPRKAAGAQITQSWHREVVTINNNAGSSRSCNWNEYNLNLLTRTNWRASLVPAAAVIPAPIAYIKVVAVKKLVVEFPGPASRSCRKVCTGGRSWPFPKTMRALHWVAYGTRDFYFEKIRVFKAGISLEYISME